MLVGQPFLSLKNLDACPELCVGSTGEDYTQTKVGCNKVVRHQAEVPPAEQLTLANVECWLPFAIYHLTLIICHFAR